MSGIRIIGDIPIYVALDSGIYAATASAGGDSGFPGMKVLEFAFDSRDTGSASDYLPHNYPVNSVA